MAKELPYFKFFPSEWIMGKISYENYSVQGLFLSACCHYWHQECDVKEQSFNKILGKNNVKKLKELDFIKVDNGKIFIEFLDEQFNELSDIHRVRVENGRKGGLSRAKAKPKQSSSIKDKDKDKDVDKDKEYFPDDFVLNEKYKQFLQFRKEIKKPLKEISIEANKKQLLKLAGNDSQAAVEIIEQSIANGWQGFFELKKQTNGTTKNEQQYFGATKIPKDYDPNLY